MIEIPEWTPPILKGSRLKLASIDLSVFRKYGDKKIYEVRVNGATYEHKGDMDTAKAFAVKMAETVLRDAMDALDAYKGSKK